MYGARHKVFTLYLRSPVNNTTFATQIFLKYMPSVLAIIPGNVLKIFKNDEVIKMNGAQSFLLILFDCLY